MEIEKNLKLTKLFDFYGVLLTERQQEIFRSYYFDDISLGELSLTFGISRQAVRDSLIKAERSLLEFEKNLNEVSKYEKVLLWINENKDKLSKDEIENLLKIWEV